MIFSFGQSQHERIEVGVLRYEREPVGEYFDDNWLTASISVQAGGFNGKIRATIFTDELTLLLKQLQTLYEMWLVLRNSPRWKGSYIGSLEEMTKGI